VPDRHRVTTTYRGKTFEGEWYVEDAQVRLVSSYGGASESVANGRSIILPSVKAERMLWRQVCAADPNPPWLYRFWGR
jgi:hypothetical protein